MNNNDFDEVCIVGSLDNHKEESGLDYVEQQRSLERQRPEMHEIFSGIPFKSDAQWFAEWRAEQRQREQRSR